MPQIINLPSSLTDILCSLHCTFFVEAGGCAVDSTKSCLSRSLHSYANQAAGAVTLSPPWGMISMKRKGNGNELICMRTSIAIRCHGKPSLPSFFGSSALPCHSEENRGIYA